MRNLVLVSQFERFLYFLALICSTIRANGKMSDYWSCNVGVRQGENLSPLLFAIYLNDFESYVSRHNTSSYPHTTLFKIEIHKLSFRPANPHSSLPEFFSTYPDTQSRLLLYLHRVQYRPQTSWILVLLSSPLLSVSMRNRYGLKADPWCNPTSTLKLPLSPAALRTFVWQPLYMSCISLTYFSGTLRSLMHLQISSLGTRS